MLDIDRKTAGRLLGVSVRTIDRYIERGRLNSRQTRGRVWLNKKEVMQLSRPYIAQPHVATNDSALRHVDTAASTFYRDLYAEAKRALTEYQQKLDQANYRIGQLESQVGRPMQLAAPDRREDAFSLMSVKKELLDLERELATAKKILRQEKLNRAIFAVITYLLLVLLPLMWYLLR